MQRREMEQVAMQVRSTTMPRTRSTELRRVRPPFCVSNAAEIHISRTTRWMIAVRQQTLAPLEISILCHAPFTVWNATIAERWVPIPTKRAPSVAAMA